jgi:hypothetical protein
MIDIALLYLEEKKNFPMTNRDRAYNAPVGPTNHSRLSLTNSFSDQSRFERFDEVKAHSRLEIIICHKSENISEDRDDSIKCIFSHE